MRRSSHSLQETIVSDGTQDDANRRETLTGIRSLLDGMAVGTLGQEEGVVGQSKEERCLLLDLPHAVLDGRSVGVGNGVEVKGDDRDAVGELLCEEERESLGHDSTARKRRSKVRTNILPRRVQRVVVVQV